VISLVRDSDATREHRGYTVQGFEKWALVYYKDKDIEPRPEASLVHYGPHRDSRTHFHNVDQFQIFYGVPGAVFQRSPIPELFVQYADAWRAYGPFSVEETAMDFFTLHARVSRHQGFMPEDRDTRPQSGARQYGFDLSPYLCPSADIAEQYTQHEAIPLEDDGLAATVFCAKSGVDLTFSLPAESAGSHVLVIDGSLVDEGESFGARTLAWVPAGSEAAHFRTGPEETTHVLVMSYPRPTWNPPADDPEQ
jgi:hypothetical protein